MSSGPKRFGRVPAGFEQAWEECQERWVPAIDHVSLSDFFEPTIKFPPYDPKDPYAAFPAAQILEPREPDPEDNDSFVPEYHDGWSALKLGIDYWRSEYDAYNERVRLQGHDGGDYDKLTANKCLIALDAFDYLVKVIGVDIDGIFRRWHQVPIIFMPSAVSNSHGEEKGTLNDLLDDAVRAYVCGAPVAAIAMCRAVLEMVLKTHYLTDQEIMDKKGDEFGLKKLISLAEARYSFLPKLRLSELKEGGDDVLHKYHKRSRLNASDKKVIIDYIRTLKTVIQKVQR